MPDAPSMLRLEDCWMQHFRQDLGSVEHQRPGAVEVQVAVGDEDAATLHRLELGPTGLLLEQLQLAQGALEAEAAGSDDEHLGVGRAHGRPGRGGGMSARRAEQARAAGNLDELRPPVAHGEGRFDPLQTNYAGVG